MTDHIEIIDDASAYAAHLWDQFHITPMMLEDFIASYQPSWSTQYVVCEPDASISNRHERRETDKHRHHRLNQKGDLRKLRRLDKQEKWWVK